MTDTRKDRVIRIQQDALNGLVEKSNASDSGVLAAADIQAAVSHCQAEINALDDDATEEPTPADLRTETQKSSPK